MSFNKFGVGLMNSKPKGVFGCQGILLRKVKFFHFLNSYVWYNFTRLRKVKRILNLGKLLILLRIVIPKFKAVILFPLLRILKTRIYSKLRRRRRQKAEYCFVKLGRRHHEETRIEHRSSVQGCVRRRK